MKKPDGYDEAKASGEFTPVKDGGHYAVIKQVSERQSSTGKDMVVVLFDFYISSNISLESVTTLVSDNIYIAACAVKVCKDDRRLVLWNEIHVATLFLCLSAKYVEKLVFCHEIKKLCCLRRKLSVHFLASL